MDQLVGEDGSARSGVRRELTAPKDNMVADGVGARADRIGRSRRGLVIVDSDAGELVAEQRRELGREMRPERLSRT